MRFATLRSRSLVLATTITVAMVLLSAGAAHADSTPIGHLPVGPVSTTTTTPGQLVAVALPHASAASGLVWRIARRFDSAVIRQVSEADVGNSVVLVFKVVGTGDTSLVFALTRGDSSSKAVKAVTHRVHSA